LQDQVSLEVAASDWRPAGLLEAVMAHTADVVITDIRMPPTNSDERIKRPGACATTCRGRVSSF
jgi:DNA-binding NarL/FixJ family response regulator